MFEQVLRWWRRRCIRLWNWCTKHFRHCFELQVLFSR